MSELLKKTCQPCAAGTPPLSSEDISALAKNIDSQWSVATDKTSINRECKFSNYYQTIAFVNSIAWVAHAQDHHPTLVVEYNRCIVTYSTHSISGLSENDFICAAKIDTLFYKEL